MVPQIRSWTFRGRTLYLINEGPHSELPAIDSQWHLAVLLLEEIKRPFFTRCPVLNPVSNDDRFEWQDIFADIALLSDVRPTMPVDLIEKLRSADFCHDCPPSSCLFPEELMLGSRNPSWFPYK